MAEVVDPASEVSDQSWIMEEPCGERVFCGTKWSQVFYNINIFNDIYVDR